MGGKAIVFDLGDSNVYAETGATLQSDVQKNIMEQVEPIQKKAEALFVVLDSVLTSVNNTISPDFQKNINRSLQSIANTLNTLENTAIQVDGMVGTQKSKISGILTNMESISANFSNNNEKLTRIFANLETVSDKAARLNFEETMNKANMAVSDLQLVVDSINNGKGSLGKLLNDDELYNNLEDASKSLDNLIIDVKQNPKRYVHFSVFGRKSE